MKLRYFHLLPISLIIAGAAGCASLQTPSGDLASKVPTLQIGQTKPQGDEYILFVPAGKDIPVKILLNGSLLTEQQSAETRVKIKQDIYLYKYWASLDGKNWQNSHRLFDVAISAGLGLEGGKVEIKVNQTQ